MTRVRALLICLTLLPAAVAFGGLDSTVQMRYDFSAGGAATSRLSARVIGLDMGTGIPLAVSGKADVDVTMLLVGPNEDGTETIRVTFGPVTAVLMGQPQPSGTPAPMEMQVDPLGRVTAVRSPEGGAPDLLQSGGIPVQLLAVIAGVVELPDHPVRIGEAWTSERTADAPGVGRVTMRMASRVQAIDGEQASVSTDVQADLPDFSARNPMQEGEIELRGGKVRIDGMQRVVDVKTGLVKTAHATLVFACQADLGPLGPTSLQVTSGFDLAPAPVEPSGSGDTAAPPAASPAPSPGPEASNASEAQLAPAAASPAAAQPRYQQIVGAVTGYVALLANAVAGWWAGR